MILKYISILPSNSAPFSLPHRLLRLNKLSVTFPLPPGLLLIHDLSICFYKKNVTELWGSWGPHWVFDIENKNHYGGVSNIWNISYIKYYP